MKFKPLVSFIIPAYNCENTIEKAVNSILNQTYKNVEIIIVEDCSNDKTSAILNKFVRNNRIKIIYNKTNMGPSFCRNLAIKECSGKYIAFCDSDDFLNLNITKAFIQLQNKSEKYDVVIFKTIRIDNNEIKDKNLINYSFKFDNAEIKILLSSIYNKFLKYNSIYGFDGICGKFIDIDLIKRNSIYFSNSIMRFEDADFCFKIYKSAKKIYYMNTEGYYYVKNSNSICNKYNINAPEIFRNSLYNLKKNNIDLNNFYIKVITTLTECEKMYFLNKRYKKKYYILKKEFKDMIDDRVYDDAINKVDFNTLPWHYKFEIFLLRKKMYFIYFMLKKIHLVING